MSARAAAPAAAPASSRDLVAYRASLRRHYWRRVVPTLLWTSFVGEFCIADLVRFRAEGVALLHPWLSLFLILNCTALALVALLVTWTITRYTSIWGDR